MSIKNNLDTYLKNLNFQLQVENMGLSSWGEVKPRAPNRQFELPTNDKLLNNKKELENKQIARQQQIQLYLEKEKQPVIVNGQEFKYNTIPPPNLEDEKDLMDEVNVKENELINEEQKFNKLVNDLKNTENDIEGINLRIIEEEKNFNLLTNDKQSVSDDLNYFVKNLRTAKEEEKKLNKKILDNNNEIKTKENLLNSSGLDPNYLKKLEKEIIGRKKREIEYSNKLLEIQNNIVKYENEETKLRPILGQIEKDLVNIKSYIEDLKIIDLPDKKKELSLIENELRNTEVEINNKNAELLQAENDYNQGIKENKKRIADYADELKRVNFGSFNVERMYGESEQEYMERLERNSQVPFDNSTVKTLSDIERNNLFKDNLKLLFQSEAFIEKILNYYRTSNDHYIFILNQYFNLFKDDYLKVYGYDNKAMLNDPENFIELVDNFCQAGDDGKPELITPSQDIENKKKYSANEPILSKLETIEKFINPLQTLTYQQKANELLRLQQIPQLTLEEQAKANIIQEELKPQQDLITFISKYNPILLNNDKLLEFTNNDEPNNIKKIYIRYIDNNIDELQGVKRINKKAPIFFYSKSGDDGSFKEISKKSSEKYSFANIFVEEFLGIGWNIFKSQFKIKSRRDRESINNLLENIFLTSLQLKPSEMDKLFFYIKRGSDNPINSHILGMGIKDDIPEYVEFGKYILLLKKLYLKNILSLHKKNHLKVPGFKNYNVSNEFVNLIMKLIKKENLTMSDMASLKIGEKELLDNLLTLCELNKKIITGTGAETLQKVKDNLRLIEGQIEAGNNNPILKDELYKTLFKLVNLGAITERQARAHYKNICNDFFN